MKILTRHPSNLQIKKGIQGQGVFAARKIAANSIIFTMHGAIITEPTKTSVQVGDNAHIEDKTAGLINHSCNPSAFVHRHTRTFISLRDIEVGDEITFDYTNNEDKMAEPFICNCCGKFIGGK